MSELKLIYDEADEDKKSEIFEVIETSLNAGVSPAVLKDKLNQIKTEYIQRVVNG